MLCLLLPLYNAAIQQSTTKKTVLPANLKNKTDLPINLKQKTETQSEEIPLLVVVIMVKNEEGVIVETLKPFVEGGIKHFFVLDTGSTDDTIAVTKKYFREAGIEEGYVEQSKFVDFATSRNLALNLAEQKFPRAGFMLMPDAEWYMQNVSGLIDFCKKELSNTQCDDVNRPCSCYSLRLLIGAYTDFQHARLIRRKGHARFEGAIHEYLICSTIGYIPQDVYLVMHTSEAGDKKTIQRWHRDLEILLKEYEKNPLNTRTLFYLAQTYHCLREYENAYHYYGLRIALNQFGFDEENFMAVYRIAQVTEELASMNAPDVIENPEIPGTNAAEKVKDQNKNIYTWEMALKYYLEAFSMRPNRAEPLIKIAQHYLDTGEMDLSCLFAQKAARIPYPKDDLLFIDKNLYDYDRFDIVGQCAWHIGDCEEGELVLRHMVKTYIDPHLHRNLNEYLEGRCVSQPKEEMFQSRLKPNEKNAENSTEPEEKKPKETSASKIKVSKKRGYRKLHYRHNTRRS